MPLFELTDLDKEIYEKEYGIELRYETLEEA